MSLPNLLFPGFPFLVFFAVVFAVYWWIGRHRLRLSWLLLASCIFYLSACRDRQNHVLPALILLILFSASVDYFAAKLIENSRSLRRKTWLMIGSISINLGVLFFFKYVNFFCATASGFLAWFKIEWTHTPFDLILPLGISFYTFETISYIVDVYRGRTKAVKNPLDYALFIMFFPHLVAGPIVRPHDFLPQVERKKVFSWNRMYLALRLFLLGFFKKAVVADHLAKVVDPVFKDPSHYASIAIWLGVLAYTIQIYCDFSGYSDMAIGVAHAFGFKLPRNFDHPYMSAGPSEFWRRWHISLSSWLRDYLYVPLGGNRLGVGRTYANLIVVMLLGGLWHGASWTFVAWGLYHGVWLALHRAIPLPSVLKKPAFRPLCMLTTFLLVALGWVFFRAQTFGDAGIMLERMFVPTLGEKLKPATALLVSICVAITLIGGWVGVTRTFERVEKRMPAPLMGAALAAFLILALLLYPETSAPFIYFQF
ncbi:MAG: MBOAT family protein [Gemmataceae bacterium]